jgi:hypothetical protein
VKPATSLILFGASMGLSALCLLIPSSGCACFMNLCAEADAPYDSACCTSGDYYYTCHVELEGPSKAEYTPITIEGCFSGADAAQEQSPQRAQAQNPGKMGRSAVCYVAYCPDAGTGGAS